ncbi:MAG: bifunctional phosphopantothenoylcysteine decarboxylase/phosphopantothenate--cysteine ligase CoaBC, partial [Acidobacteria bacterium]|nr:bifunctional phosphopantothenoylcysteine decarboxylase/phosphopantothenate--cysteine ligase CoaBC [Acidobacteriota bacterium]
MRILVGITGGIAAYKSASLVRLLSEAGHEIKVLPTANALKFIGSATLEALSHNSVDPDLYSQVEDVKHIKLAQEAELVIVAPATAAFLARYSHGLADDLLLNVLLATSAPVYVAPAMHTEMWNNPATKANVETLIGRGVNIIEPGVGRLTGSDTGVGRMAEPEDIFKQLFASRDGSLTGKHVVIAAGGTQEPIDAVRFIGNRSSGKQGAALAKSALMRGAQVTLIDCNMTVAAPSGAEVIKAPTAHELQRTLEQLLGTADVIMMPVAVSDFSISNTYPGKLSRVENQTVAIELTPNPDILTGLTAAARASNLKV